MQWPPPFRAESRTGERASDYEISQQKHYRLKAVGNLIRSAERKSRQPRKLYLAKPSFKIEGEINTFLDKQKLKAVHRHSACLREPPTGVLQGKMPGSNARTYGSPELAGEGKDRDTRRTPQP